MFSSVTFYHLSNRYLSTVTQISAKINTMQSNNSLITFCSFTVLNKHKALQLSKVGLSTIKHQHSKNLTRWTEATWTKNTWELEKCKLFARVYSQKVFKCPPFARTHAWRRFLHWSIAVSVMSCRKSDHITIQRSFGSLTTENEQIVKCWYFA